MTQLKSRKDSKNKKHKSQLEATQKRLNESERHNVEQAESHARALQEETEAKEAAERKVKELAASLKEEKEKYTNLTRTLQRTEEDLEETRRNLDLTRKEADETKELRLKAEAKAESLAKELSETRKKNERLERSVEKNRKKKLQGQESLVDIKRHLEEVRATKDSLESQNNAMSEDLRATKHRNNFLEKEIEELKNRVAKSGDNFEEVLQQLNDERKRANELESDNRRWQMKVELTKREQEEQAIAFEVKENQMNIELGLLREVKERELKKNREMTEELTILREQNETIVKEFEAMRKRIEAEKDVSSELRSQLSKERDDLAVYNRKVREVTREKDETLAAMKVQLEERIHGIQAEHAKMLETEREITFSFKVLYIYVYIYNT